MKTILLILSSLFMFGTFLPLYPNNHWFFRGQHYVKSIYLILLTICFFILIFFFEINALSILFLAFILLSIIYCAVFVIPYTIIFNKRIKTSQKANAQDSSKLKIFTHNVYQENEDYQKVLDLIEEMDPDIIFLLETDEKWDEGTSSLKEKYPYNLKEIRDNMYGLIFYSRHQIVNGAINHLTDPEIPSISGEIELNGHRVYIFGAHPKPPSPTEAERSIEKNKELIAVANLIAKKTTSSDYYILVGDLNDVAWSKTSHRLMQIAKMTDPRIGRGLYGTFHAKSPFKIPLDHLFCSKNFRLGAFKVLENVGSDHLPVYAELVIT